MTQHDFAALRTRFFRGYLQRHPEEGSTLGWREGDDRLRDHSPGALSDEHAFYTAIGAELRACDPAALAQDDRLDHLVMTRVIEHHLHLGQALWQGIDWSMYPCIMVQMQMAHAERSGDIDPIAARLDQVERFLQQHQHNVEQAFGGPRPPDGMLAHYFADVQLPAAARYLREELLPLARSGCAELPEPAAERLAAAGERAASAYEAHRQWVREQVMPHAVDDYRLGEQEVCWRLQHTFGIDETPSQLVGRAEQNLREVHRAFITLAQQIAPGIEGAPAQIEGMAEARALAMTMQQAHIDQREAIAPLYQDYIDRARQLAEAKGLFNVPDDYTIGIVPLPAGLDHAGHAGNWPAPLLDAGKLGHFAVAQDPKAHPLAWAADLAIHEGFPGHHLQSLCWQRRFGGSEAPVRFLLVHDQVAIPRHYWGAMLNIEGYAVYAEELMRQAGFFTPQEELFVLLAHAVRAARVVVDLKLHCGEMSTDEAVRYLMDQVCFPEGTAKREVRRYMQIPLQAGTYLLGRLAIESLKREVRAAEGDAFSEASFHDRFFSYGPIDPESIRACMLP